MLPTNYELLCNAPQIGRLELAKKMAQIVVFGNMLLLISWLWELLATRLKA